MKKVYIPGELITSDQKRVGKNAYLKDGKVYSSVLGLADSEKDIVNVVSFKGKYFPAHNDVVIGIVVQEVHSGYLVDVNSFYFSYIHRESVRDRLNVGSIVSAKVSNVDEVNDISLENPRFMFGGEVFSIVPVKVPRLIGKNGSMLDIIKQGTGSSLVVGKNGFVWAKGGNIDLLRKVVRLVEAEAHLPNLTAKVEDFLKNNS